MNKMNPLLPIIFVTLPQVLLFLCLALSGAMNALLTDKYGIAGAVLALAAALFAVFCGIAKRKETAPVKPLVGLLVLLAAACGFTTLSLFISPLPAIGFSPGALALALGAVGILYLSVRLYLSRSEVLAAKLRRDMSLFVLLPFAVSFALNFSVEQVASTLLMNAGIALCCAAAVYFILFVLTYLRAPGTAEETGAALAPPERTGFAKFAHSWVSVLVFAIILLQVGLLVNYIFDGLLGDYSSPWFIVLFLMNGIVMLPFWRNKQLPLPILYLKMVGFSIVAYMTFVFIPYMPFGIFGIIAMGLGLLMFVPLLVFIMELRQITDDVRELKKRWSTSAIALVMVAGVLTIPAAFAANAFADKLNYQNAQAYMYPTGTEQREVDLIRLARTLDEMETSYYERLSFDPWADMGLLGTPLFSPAYHEIVPDGKALSGKSLNRMRSIFFDERQWEQNGWSTSLADSDSFQPGDPEVLLQKASTRTEFDEQAGVYKTWVDLEIKNSGENRAEYAVRFHLPDGCFIKDYYLYVGDEQKFGMLTDERSALITYESVTRAAQDPGVLRYTDSSTLELRVFPFEKYETRKTGFYVMHAQPETLEINGQKIVLDAPMATPEPLEMDGATFIPAAYKQELTAASRPAEYYFVVDASFHSPVREHLLKIKDYAKKHDIKGAHVLFASYKIQQVNLSDIPEDIPVQVHFNQTIGGENVRARGGFNLGAAMWLAHTEQVEQYLKGSVPLVIAVSDNMPSAVLQEDMREYTQYFPESEYYYNLGYDLSLLPYRFSDGEQTGKTVDTPIISEALEYDAGRYVSAKPESETLYQPAGDPTQIEFLGGEYENAFLLMQKTLLLPGSTDVVRDAFRQKTLTPATAFSVFETKEQEADLLALQEAFMSGKITEATDAAPPVSMDESLEMVAAFAVAVGLAALAVWRRRKRRGTA